MMHSVTLYLVILNMIFAKFYACHSDFISFFSFLTDEIMQQEIRPLLAVDIIEQLHRQFALLSGEI